MRLSTSMLPDVVALTGTYDEQPRDLLGDRRRWDDLRAVGEELFEVVARWLRATNSFSPPRRLASLRNVYT
jgi:hypothetical protein